MPTTDDGLTYGEVYNPHIGSLAINTSSKGIVQVKFIDPGERGLIKKAECKDLDAFMILSQAISELGDFLAGNLAQPFQTPIDWMNIPGFQRKVLEKVIQIPFGRTCAYGDIARQIGQPGAARAVGLTLSKNPILIFIPCHRVLGRDHRLHGFAAPGGTKTKAWLLALEGVRVDKDLVTGSSEGNY
jgi:methylated-DNA-[protein]-cysteine S-methyltransferase